MKVYLSFIFLAFATCAASAAPVFSSACYVHDSGYNYASGQDTGMMTTVSSVGETFCTAGLPGPFFASYAVAFTNYAFDASNGTVRIAQQNQVSPGALPTVVGTSAQTSVSDLRLLTTPGPVRDGKLLITIQNSGVGPVYNWQGGAGLTFSDIFAPSPYTNYNSFFSCSFGGFYPSCSYDALNQYDRLGGFDVKLGTDFALNINSRIYSAANNGLNSDGNGSGSLNVAVHFQFTELDGTPVELIAIPEPGTTALLLVSCLSALVAFGGSRSLRRRPLVR